MAQASCMTVTLCCYTCWGTAVGDGPIPYITDPAVWPELPCPVTPGCRGRLVPEALN